MEPVNSYCNHAKISSDIHVIISVDVSYSRNRILLDDSFLGYGLDISVRQKVFLHDSQVRVLRS
jgi:hypothetical protein